MDEQEEQQQQQPQAEDLSTQKSQQLLRKVGSMLGGDFARRGSKKLSGIFKFQDTRSQHLKHASVQDLTRRADAEKQGGRVRQQVSESGPGQKAGALLQKSKNIFKYQRARNVSAYSASQTEEQKTLISQLQAHNQVYKTLRILLGLEDKKPLHSKLLKLRRQQILSYAYRVIFQKGIEFVNYSHKKQVLKDLWSQLELKRVDPYVNFN